MPWRLLLGLGGFFAVAPRRTIAAITPIEPVAAAAEPAAAAKAAFTALVALAVAIGLAHHRRRAFLELVNAHRQVAQDVFVDPLLPLDLDDRGRRRIDVQQREMRLAVLSDAERERLDAPV